MSDSFNSFLDSSTLSNFLDIDNSIFLYSQCSETKYINQGAKSP